MLTVQRMRPDELLQRPPERESLKVAAGVSPVSEGRGHRREEGGARVSVPAGEDLVSSAARTSQAEPGSALCRGMDRARRGSCPRLRVLKGSRCVAGVIVAWLVKMANEIWGELKFSLSLFPVLQLHPQR